MPRVDNAVIAGLIDQHMPVSARVSWMKKTKYAWEKLGIRITMAAETGKMN